MRVSTLRNDPGFKNLTSPMDVYLGGTLMQHCVTADEELGLVVCIKVDKNGVICVEDNEIQYVEYRGLVRIEPKPYIEPYIGFPNKVDVSTI